MKTRKALPGEPSLDPGQLENTVLEGINENWRRIMHSYHPCDGLCINYINGQPGNIWSFRAEGPPAFSINILLEGRMQGAIENGPVINARAGSAILMASNQHTSGWDILDGQSESAFRMVCIHLPQNSLTQLTGLHINELSQRIATAKGEQPHVDAFLGVMPASHSLQRVGAELLTLGCGHSNNCLIRNLRMRAKALEAIACFLHENTTVQEAALPIPGDRNRLLEARSLLETSYSNDWKVSSLARAVGLNENRLQTGFQAMFGSSVHACLIRIRMDAATKMLQQGASVTETALAVGFTHLSHFSRMFRNHTGLSPKQYVMGGVGKNG